LWPATRAIPCCCPHPAAIRPPVLIIYSLNMAAGPERKISYKLSKNNFAFLGVGKIKSVKTNALRGFYSFLVSGKIGLLSPSARRQSK
jgi:hypothetical protein